MSPHHHPLPRTVYVGTVIDVPSPAKLRVRANAIVGVDEGGIIVFVRTRQENFEESGDAEGEWIRQESERCGWGKRGWEVVRAVEREGEFWFPGFVDTHIHAPQYPNSGIFGSSTLLDWLNKYTFPLEASLCSLSNARAVYTRCVAATLRNGTTTAAYYATIHTDSTNLLASICLAAGQRSFIGRCAMDSDINPDYYRDKSPTSAIEETCKTITHIESIDPDYSLISPIITPRFAPSCSEKLLCALGDLAHETALPIQTHIAENPDELNLVASLFPTYASYAAVYDGTGLLTPRTVLAHAIHLSADERALIKKKGAKISHCPISNSCLSSGLCSVRQFLDEGIDVGLGTDVSGGWSPSVLAVAREAATVSRILASVQRDSTHVKKNTDTTHQSKASLHKPAKEHHPHNTTPPEPHDCTKLSVEECLHLATVGGARCLGLETRVGHFEVGMHWDAQLVRLGPAVHLDLHPHNTTTNPHPHPSTDPSKISNAAPPAADSMKPSAGLEDLVVVALKSEKGQRDEGPVQLWGSKTWEEKLAKWVFGGDERNTRRVWVRGRVVSVR